MSIKSFPYLLLFFITVLSFSLPAQSLGLLLPDNKAYVDIPFEYENNFIIVNVEFNRVLPLKFLFDTGAEHTILMDRALSDLLGFDYERVIPIIGADLETIVNALLIRNVHLKVGRLHAPTQDMLVLDEDIFKFSDHVGIEVHGIIGADLFRRHIIKIDYKKRIIRIYKASTFSPPRKASYEVIDIDVVKHKPYLQTNIQLLNGNTLNSRLLIDTGASVTLLLSTNTHPDLQLPRTVIPSNIGAGLGGYVQGFLGRVQSLDIASTTLPKVITYFQEQEFFHDSTRLYSRNGVIGNVILQRYNMIIDYTNEKLYLSPTKLIKKAFKYDKSGMSIIASGRNKDKYIVQIVHPNSPASEVGIQKGDQIIRVRGIPSNFLTLSTINSSLERKAGKITRLVILRDGEKIKKNIKLRDLI